MSSISTSSSALLPVANLFRSSTGNYLFPGGSTTTLAATDAQMRTAPLLIVEAITIDRITCEVTVLAALSAFRMGIYSDSATRPGYPGALVLDAGTVDTTTTGVKEITISQALSPGLYWLAGVAQGGAPTMRGTGEPYVPLAGYGESSASTAKRCWVQSAVSGALPNPHSTTLNTGGTAFRILLRQA